MFQKAHARACTPTHTNAPTCAHTHMHAQIYVPREGHGSAPEGLFFQGADCSKFAFVALIFIITVVCSGDREWRWACLFSCNCLFPSEISMSDPFIVIIIACLIFCLPERSYHSAFGMVGTDYGAQWGSPLMQALRQLCPQAAGLSGAASGIQGCELQLPSNQLGFHS